MGIFGSRQNKETSLADADRENQAFMASAPDAPDAETAQAREAAVLMSSQDFAGARAKYQQLADAGSDKRGLYLSQVGAAEHFLGDYDAAIGTYLAARDAGFDEDMLDDNVWESCEAIVDRGGDNASAALERYLSEFPKGGYAKKARKQLGR